MAHSFFAGGIHRSGTGGATVIILGAGWLLGRSAAFSFAAATLALSFAQAAMARYGHSLPVYFPDPPFPVWTTQVGIVVLAGLPVLSLMDRQRRQVVALRESEGLLNASQRVAGLGTYVFDLSSGAWTSSPVLDDVLGIDVAYPRSAQGWLALIHPEWREQMMEYLSDPVAKEELRFDKEYQILRRQDGRERWVQGRGELELAGNSKTGRIVGTILDITERKRTEEALRKAEVHYHRLFESLSDATLVFKLEKDGLSSQCIDANEHASRLLGYTREQLLTLRVFDISPCEDHAAAPDIVHRLFTEGHLVREQALLTKDGRRVPVEINSHVFDLDGTPTMISCIRNISERKEAEATKAKLEEDVRQAQKMESVGRLAGGIAHDFNNLLTIINGYSCFLLKELNGTDPLRSYAEQIANAGRSAACLTKQLLTFSRKQVIEPRVLDLNTIIQDSTAMLQPLIGQDIVFEIHLGRSPWRVMADSNQIHQVIMNLTVNARDAMPNGGKLLLETTNVQLDAETSAAINHDVRPGDYVLITVTDTGCGIDETVLRQIFEPFFTTKEVGEGTGLGLSIVYGIVRQSAGWIEVRSVVGVGTSFRIYLPRIEADQVLCESGAGTSTKRGAETILIVEDQAAVREFTSAALRHFGYRVLEASNSEEALAVVKQEPGAIHLLLTDVVTPGMSGKELSDRIKEVHPNLKTLFTSGYNADVIAPRGVLDHGVAFVYKPFSPDELAAKVRDILV
jgi:PAS domain S-box-containing protein